MRINKYIIILMVFICFLLTSCKKEKKVEVTIVDNETTSTKSADLASTISNINFNDWLYFGNPDDNYKIYRMKIDGTGLTKIADARFDGISNLENWIYYIDTNEKYTPAKLARISWDGTGKEILSEEDVNAFCTSEDYIFYIFENNIYRIQKDGSLKTKIVSTKTQIYSVKYNGDTVFYSTDQGLFSIDSDGKNPMLLLEGNFTNFSVSNDRIYYFDNKMYSCALDGSDERQLFDLNVSDVFVVNDVIYYNQDEYLYKINSYDGKTNKIFMEKTIKDFYEKDNYLYFYGQNRIWKVKTDLSEKKIFIGTGGEQHHKMYIKVDNRIFSKNFESLDSADDLSSYKLYEVVGDEMGKKISDIAINMFDTNNGNVYYTDAVDKRLYCLDINMNEKKLVIDKMIGSFIIYNNLIYYTDMNDNYKLHAFNIRNRVITNITNIPVSNIKCSGTTIYFLDNKKRIGIYNPSTGNESRYINVFTTTYDIIGDIIYYKNEDDDGRLYKIKSDGSENIKITENTIKDIYASDANIYYVEKNGANLLYRISNKQTQGEFLDIINMAYTDMEIIDGKFYMSVASEGGSYYTVEKYLEDLKFHVSFDMEKQVDEKWKYFVYKVDGYMGYLYKYNVDTNEIRLIVDKWVTDFQIEGKYVYYSGLDGININFTTYIDRINLETDDINSIIIFIDPKIYNISFQVMGDYIYYSLDNSTDGCIWKKNLISNEQTVIVDDSSNLENIIDGWLYYQNNNKRLGRVRLDGSDKQILTNTYSEFIYADKNELYYLSISGEDSFKGIIIKRNIDNDSKEVVVNKEIAISDLIVINDKLYYNFEGINKYDFRNDNTTKVYNKEVDYFSLIGDLLYISIHEGENYKTIKMPLQ
ncbi:DUF5050 domain-containing protein [Vallitalea sp.]|uniref:DUF5050 domain-containing protein n=1 Tax=Vallitalea sp. TaxID=1882829 RepID=UPI0025FFA24C|nr:DUF5050 domain-containing protein [Vallitalea sp.]MCT4686177.1 DUF5050 domain-containing protein [Vallitalea sp.]